MPRRRKGNKKAEESVQILSDALDDVVSLSSASPLTTENIPPTPRKPRKSKKYTPSSISSYAELITAIEAGEPHLVLSDNIIVEDNILIKQNLIIDFNGFSIIAEDNLPSARILDIRSGEVTLAGKGKIFAMGPNGVAIRVFGAISSGIPEYTVLHVGPDIQLFAPSAYGILVSPNLGVAYGLTVNFAGRIFARDGICVANGINGHDLHLPTINIKPGSSITADEASGAAIEAIGYSAWHISGTRLSGAVGANLKSGQLDFNNPQIIANAGPTINLIESSAKDLEVALNQGNYASMVSDLIMGSPTPVKKFTAKGCTFYGSQNIISPELKKSINPKSSSLRSDITTFLESLISQPEPEATPEEVAVEQTDVIEDPILEDFNLDEDIDIMIEDTTVDAHEPSEILDSLEDTEPLELLSELKIEHTKRPPLAESIESDPTVEELINAAFSDESDEKPELNNADIIPDTPSIPEPVVPPVVTPSPQLTAPLTRPTSIIAAPHSSSLEPKPLRTPLPILGAPTQPTLFSEQDAAHHALSEAITEIRKLKPEDYEAGFADLERALRKAEHILASPLADLADIRDASSMLLQAFDSLEERDEFSLSDEELDELFYHGAVLEEVARPQGPTKPSTLTPKTVFNAPKSAPTILQPLAATLAPAQSLEPDFSVLSEIITTIAGLKLDNYTPESQEALLDELDRAELVLSNMSSSQSEIDEIATSLLAEMSKLERTRSSHASTPDRTRISTPAPVVGARMPATMIDEMAPATTWMLGITMIDEMTPYLMDVSTRQRILRAMQPWINEIIEMATEPFKKLSRSIVIGIRAGRHAYRESLRSGARF